MKPMYLNLEDVDIYIDIQVAPAQDMPWTSAQSERASSGRYASIPFFFVAMHTSYYELYAYQ